MADRTQALDPILQRLGLRKEHRPKTPSQINALDVEGTTLRVVQSNGRGVISRVLAAPLDLAADADRNDPGVLGPAISRALNKLGVRPSAAVMGIPRAKVVLRTLTVPVIEKQSELASIVHFQVGKDLPFRMEEAVIDFKVRRQILPPPERVEPRDGPDGSVPAPAAPAAPKLEVLVAAVKREVVEFYQKLAEAAGFKLLALGLLPYANARCVEASKVADGDGAFALISLRPDEVAIDIIAQQSLLFSRGAALRVAADVPAEQGFVPAAVIEVVRSLHSYSGLEANPTVGNVVVTGATGHEAEVANALAPRLATPCTVLDPATALALPADAREAAAGAMGALGLALGMGDGLGLPFDFLNPKQPAVQRDMRRIWILSSVAAVAVLGTAVLGLRTWLVTRRTEVLNAASTELAEAEKKRPVYRKLLQQTAVVEDWIKGERDWLEHYAYLTSVLPASEELYLTSLAVSGQNIIRMSVQARSGETLARLEKQLVAAGYEVKPIAITPGADRFGYEFRSTVELSVPAKLKIDLHKVKPPQRPIDDVSMDTAAWRKGVQ
jgi:Tfp pilus assembly PilM family ATPase